MTVDEYREYKEELNNCNFDLDELLEQRAEEANISWLNDEMFNAVAEVMDDMSLNELELVKENHEQFLNDFESYINRKIAERREKEK